MKAILLSALLFFTLHLKAQKQIQFLPTGTYEAVIKSNDNKWEKGDLILLDGNKYKLSTTNETGDYRFSSAAQRLFFLSGPLKGLYAKTASGNDTPTIVLPVPENEQIGFKLSSEVWCYYKQYHWQFICMNLPKAVYECETNFWNHPNSSWNWRTYLFCYIIFKSQRNRKTS